MCGAHSRLHLTGSHSQTDADDVTVLLLLLSLVLAYLGMLEVAVSVVSSLTRSAKFCNMTAISLHST